ncbi:MAG: pantoate--beta-alanine ligase [Dysgonamonadaceae bacterium]|jgi:pantoate--beta-alanine ligase|nr:pantoate--beta-alanine ligase [Dysgonamonadaceae bacterium]
MQVLHTIINLQNELSKDKGSDKTIGFVPTMGALHQGHLELVRRSVVENDVTVVSIFVNPTQFNDKTDLLKYPRNLQVDCDLLRETGCTYVFAPDADEIYPEPDTRRFDFGALANVMEGRFRPGHFNGVAQVVSRLFDIVKPDKAYFGEKDFQQLAIIRAMVKQLQLNIQIIACPIVREADGLAMSSRNIRLSDTQRKEAVFISKTLFDSREKQKDYTVPALKNQVIAQINAMPDLQVEYFEIVDGYTLQSIDNWNDTNYPVACIAVFAGEVRLIDKISY